MNFQELYEQKIIELEDMRRRALASQMALMVILLEQGGEVFVQDVNLDRVSSGEASGWKTEETDKGVWFRVTTQTSE